MHKYVVYQDKQQEWRWTFYAENGEAIAVSSEGYVDERDCRHAIEVIQNFGGQQHAIVEKGEPEAKAKKPKKAAKPK